jgi:hypothetical protein
MKGFSSEAWRQQRAKVAQALAGGELGTQEDVEYLALLDEQIVRAQQAEAGETRRNTHLRRQKDLSAQGERAYKNAFRRIGREPPELSLMDQGAFAVAMMMSGRREPGPIGAPMAAVVTDFFVARRADALQKIARARQLWPRA